MSLIITIGKDVSLVRCNVLSKGIEITGFAHVQEFTPDVVTDAGKTEELIRKCFAILPVPSDARYEDWYVVFLPPSGIVYKTWQIPTETLVDSSDKTPDEKEQRVLNACLDGKPEGITELYEAWSVSVVASNIEENMTTLTAAFLPQLFLDNIVKAAEKCGIVLMAVTEVASGLKNILNPESNDKSCQYICRLESCTIAVNPFGVVAWVKPDTVISEMDGVDIISEISRTNFGFEPERMNVFLDKYSYRDALSFPVLADNTAYNSAEFETILVSAGVAYNQLSAKKKNTKIRKVIEEDVESKEEGGGKLGFADRIRKLFKKE